MPYLLYDYVEADGANPFLSWARGLESGQRAKLNVRLDMLANVGPSLYPHVLTGTDEPGIQKLRIRGNVQWRPLLCEGPINVSTEFTLLSGAKEVAFKLVPKGVLGVAKVRKDNVIADPKKRRVLHVRP